MARYGAFMDAVAELVAVRFGGSLKAEHGTGRNMAPYVELEWGPEGMALMRRIKALLDPGGLLNPGVIINDDPKAHLTYLKPMPASDAIVDPCIECGFCEAVCPSRTLSLSPRQRIVLYRELARRNRADEPSNQLARLFDYQASTPAPPPGSAPIAARWASTPAALSRSCALTSTGDSCPSPAGAPITSPASPARRAVPSGSRALPASYWERKRWQGW